MTDNIRSVAVRIQVQNMSW